MVAQSSFCIQGLSTCFTLVCEEAQEVFRLHMVPDVVPAHVAESVTDATHVSVRVDVFHKESVQVLMFLYVVVLA